MSDRQFLTGDFVLFERHRYNELGRVAWSPGSFYNTFPTDGVRAVVLHSDGTYTVEWKP